MTEAVVLAAAANIGSERRAELGRLRKIWKFRESSGRNAGEGEDRECMCSWRNSKMLAAEAD